MRTALAMAVVVVCLSRAFAGDVIEVAPGSGTISAAAARAADGDTLKLAPGEYTDSVELGEGVTLEGSGADSVTITGTGYAVFNCVGPRVTVRGVTIRPGEATTRGINASLPVRVERCRFEGVKEGVAMMAAPLSDVLACEFNECSIGVRAIGGACPTVWGCVFRGGRIGVFSMEGAPYVRNNVFVGSRAGMRMAVDSVQQAIVRNNLFLDCTVTGVEVIGKEAPIIGPSIRNNIFVGVGAAGIGVDGTFGQTSHCLVRAENAFHDAEDRPTLDTTGRALAIGECGAAIADDGSVSYTDTSMLVDKGVRAAEEPEGATGRIGPELDRVGIGVGAELPSTRFVEGSLIANAVMEEYQYLAAIGAAMSRQASGTRDGRDCDWMHCRVDGKQVEIAFDISRFFGESSID
jgi:hypothetical protein